MSRPGGGNVIVMFGKGFNGISSQFFLKKTISCTVSYIIHIMFHRGTEKTNTKRKRLKRKSGAAVGQFTAWKRYPLLSNGT